MHPQHSIVSPGAVPVVVAGLLFDLDNTLFDRDQTFLSWAQWFVRVRLAVASDADLARVVALMVTLDANGYGAKDRLFGTLKAQFPHLAEDVQSLTTAFYAEHLSHLALDTDTVTLLTALDQHSIPWGIVTNGSRYQWLKIRKLGFDRRTHCVFISEVVGIRKPAREIFLRAAACLGVEPPQILFIGDNLEADIVGAAAVGMRTAWFSRGRRWPGSLGHSTQDIAITSLANLTVACAGTCS